MLSFARDIKSAQTEQNLDDAGKHFAKAVALGGITVISAMFFKTRPKAFKEPFFAGPVKIPRVPQGLGLKYKPIETLAQIKSPPGQITRGITDVFGNITVEIRQSAAEINETLLHERVHTFLTPKLYFMREVRIKLAMEGYNRSYFLRYVEEALAETYALVRSRGLGATLEGIKFPVKNGYVTVEAMGRELHGVSLGTVLVGGTTYRICATSGRP